ncbi:uncharacterized protein PAF06_004932 [Gastrophryne carolinensis]
MFLVLLLQLLSVSSGTVYVRTGSDISYCGMKCPDPWGALELYRICGATDEPLLENFCKDQYIKNHISSRLHLDMSSGCWTLTHAQRSDSCVYNIYHYSKTEYVRSSTDIRVLDPVLISNISSNCSRLGEDIAVSVHYSGEESAVTWELEGARLPERYRLIDDNRTLIIPSVQRGDAQRRFRVTVTNLISEETRDYCLNNDSSFQRLLEEDPVLIYNMTSNSSRLGEDFTVSVHYSREESAVTWELEGARLPERYRLIDDNRTLIIPSVQRGDAQRRFRVTVTNRVSEETREYQLSNDPNFQRLLEEGFITVSLKEQNCKMKVNKIPAKETLQDFVLTAQT